MTALKEGSDSRESKAGETEFTGDDDFHSHFTAPLKATVHPEIQILSSRTRDFLLSSVEILHFQFMLTTIRIFVY